MLISAERLRELLWYEQATGRWIRVRQIGSHPVGSIAGYQCIDGRLMRHDPTRDDPYFETDIGQCPHFGTECGLCKDCGSFDFHGWYHGDIDGDAEL